MWASRSFTEYSPHVPARLSVSGDSRSSADCNARRLSAIRARISVLSRRTASSAIVLATCCATLARLARQPLPELDQLRARAAVDQLVANARHEPADDRRVHGCLQAHVA